VEVRGQLHFMLWLIYALGKEPLIPPLNRRLGGPRNNSECGG